MTSMYKKAAKNDMIYVRDLIQNDPTGVRHGRSLHYIKLP